MWLFSKLRVPCRVAHSLTAMTAAVRRQAERESTEFRLASFRVIPRFSELHRLHPLMTIHEIDVHLSSPDMYCEDRPDVLHEASSIHEAFEEVTWCEYLTFLCFG